MDRASETTAASQRQAILARLNERGSITTIQAREELGVMHPSGRVLELRRQGHNIITAWIIQTDAAGVTHRQGKYLYTAGAKP